MNILARVKSILLQPKREWPLIAQERVAPLELYQHYVLPLALIPPLATLIGMSFIGFDIPEHGRYRFPFSTGLSFVVVTFLLSLVGVQALAMIINALAPNFGGQAEAGQALKLAVYSSTPSWVAGVFGIVPALAIFSLLGLYSFYLLFLGIPVLMRAPKEKAGVYTAVVVACAIVLFLLLGLLSNALLPMPQLPGGPVS